jgi:hypothetical protein
VDPQRAERAKERREATAMNPTTVIGAIVGIGVIVLLPMMLAAYRKFRGTRLITCPATHEPAAIELDAKHAALRAVVGGSGVTIEQCSRWPAQRDCGQECLSQIQQTPDGCRVRSMLTKWYEGKSCVLCGVPFGAIYWLDHKPGLWSPDGAVVEWAQVANETLPQVLASHQPVCWNCLIAESFRAANPGLVIDRPAPQLGRPPVDAH